MTEIYQEVNNYTRSDHIILKIDKLLLCLFILYALSSSYQMITAFDLLNKILVIALCIVILARFCLKKQPKWTYLILAVTGGLHAISLLYPISSKEGIGTYFMFAFWVLFWLYISVNLNDLYYAALSSRIIIWSALYYWTVTTLISLALPICYQVGWGGERYFTSFTTTSFEIAPIAALMLSFDILLYKIDKNKKKAIVFSAVPVLCVLASGTRTYLVIIVIEFLILLRLICSRKGSFYLISVLTMIVLILIGMQMGISRKFEATYLNTNDLSIFLNVFTSGRSEFWQVDLDAFISSDWFNICFGHGFSYVYDLNEIAVGTRLYAHNDFLNILLNFGVVGLAVYFAAFLPAVYKVTKGSGCLLSVLYVGVWLFNAFFNMIYVYISAVVALGILGLAIYKIDIGKVKVLNSNTERLN